MGANNRTRREAQRGPLIRLPAGSLTERVRVTAFGGWGARRNVIDAIRVRGACTPTTIAPAIDAMGEFLLDLFPPKTDRIVLIQTIVMGCFWAIVITAT